MAEQLKVLLTFMHACILQELVAQDCCSFTFVTFTVANFPISLNLIHPKPSLIFADILDKIDQTLFH